MPNDRTLNLPISRLLGALQQAVAFKANPHSCPHCGARVGIETQYNPGNEMVSTGLDGFRCESCPEDTVVPGGKVPGRHVSVHHNTVREW